jgi:TetR/AcrR family fatty acid metabolism transcriptional regulator
VGLVRTKTPEQADKILAVAGRLFATHRFHEARMEDIAAAAGVGKGTVYRYFKDKDELYLTLLARAGEQMSCRLREAVGGTQEPRARLVDVAACYLTYFDEHPHLFDLIQHAEAMHKGPDDFPWQKTREESIRLMTQVLEEGREAGTFAFAAPDLSALMFLGGLRAVIRFGERPRPPDLARRFVDAFVDGATAAADTPSPRASRRALAAAIS